MALWCRDFPTVTVPKDETPKRLTLVVPFYQCQRFFERQLRGWLSYPAELLAHLSVIVVDDGSPEPVRLPSWVGAVPKSMLSFLRAPRRGRVATPDRHGSCGAGTDAARGAVRPA
jgi:hypothetical protein